MTPAEINIERVVAEVLARLLPKIAPTATAGTLVISARVVTLADIEGRLDGVRQLVVPARAIVTPAARDRLRERDVNLTYQTVGTGGRGQATEGKTKTVVLGVTGGDFNTTGLISALERDGVKVEKLARSGLVSVIQEMSDEVTKGGRPGVLLTDSGAAALCVANRQRGVRAVLATDRSRTQRDGDTIGANMLVIETNKNGYELQRIVRDFCTAGPRPCPESLAKALS